MQQCRIIYCSLAALHVSSDIFAHHQEHLNCIYNFWYYTRMLLLAGVITPAGNDIRVDQEHLNCIYNFWYYTRMLLPAGVITPASNDMRV